jgi:predicted dehydrogenase
MLRDKSRLAVVGLGWFGQKHLEVWRQIETVDIVGVCDNDPAVLSEIEKTRLQDAFHQEVGGHKNKNPLAGIPRFNSVAGMLEEVNPDILDIVTPEKHHFQIACEGIEKNCDVIVEKPFVLNFQDAEQLVQKAREQGVKLYVGHILRFDARYRALASMLAGSNSGDLRHISLDRNFQASGHDVYGRTHPAFAACIHDIDLAIWLSKQDVVSVSAVERHFLERETPDVFVSILEFDSGAIGVIQNVWHIAAGCPYGFEFQTRVFTKDNTYCIRNEPVIHHWGKDATHYPEMFFWPYIDHAPQGALKDELQHFERCSRSGSESEVVPLEDVLKCTKIAECLIETAKTGKPAEIT